MKNKIKKNRLKIFIALSLMITTILGVMFATNTHAYETDTFTYSNITVPNYNTTTINGMTGYLWDPNNNNVITFANSTNTSFSISSTFLINFYVVDSSDNSIITTLGTSTYQYNLRSNSGSNLSTFRMRGNSYNSNYMYTMVCDLCSSTNWVSTDSAKTFNLGQAISISSKMIFIVNVDVVEPFNIGLPQYYETYYSQIEQQYDELLEDYNDLQDNYDTLQDNYDTLQDNYDTLENNYNDLQDNYNDLTNTDTNGLWAFFSGFSIGYIDNNNTWQTLEAYQTFEDFKNSQYNYLNGISINLSNLKTRYPNYDKFSFSCQANNNGTPLLLNSLSYKINNDGNKCQNGIVLESWGNTVQLDYTNLIQIQFKVNYENIFNNIGYYDENKRVSILLFNFEYDNTNNFEITSLNNEYNNGYNVGYQKGRESLNYLINSLNEKIYNLENQVNTQQRTINALSEQVHLYETNDSYGLNNLMWTIAATPFESFKQIWNINFFGVNIANFILGLLTTFIALIVIKKFFR